MTRAALGVAAFSLCFGLVAGIAAIGHAPAAANDESPAERPEATTDEPATAAPAASNPPDAAQPGRQPDPVDPHVARERRIRELVKLIRRDQQTLTAIISQPAAVAQADPSDPDAAPSEARVPPLPLREDVRELALRLPRLQQELRELGGEWALLSSPVLWR